MLLPTACRDQEGGGVDKEESTEKTMDEEEETIIKQQRAVIVECMKRLGDMTHHFWNKYNLEPSSMY